MEKEELLYSYRQLAGASIALTCAVRALLETHHNPTEVARVMAHLLESRTADMLGSSQDVTLQSFEEIGQSLLASIRGS